MTGMGYGQLIGCALAGQRGVSGRGGWQLAGSPAGEDQRDPRDLRVAEEPVRPWRRIRRDSGVPRQFRPGQGSGRP